MARYHRAIPPGGTGEIILTIDTRNLRGDFDKKAIVWTNDLPRMSIALHLRGKVKPHISLEPGGYVSLWGTKDKPPRGYVEITNHHESPMKIIGVDNDLPQRVGWRLKEIRPGFVYGLAVEDISREEGEYTAYLTIRTDNPDKPRLTLTVVGRVTEN